jgi:c(7)-type cytochrome triheme protein
MKVTSLFSEKPMHYSARPMLAAIILAISSIFVCSAADIRSGKQVYDSTCSACHAAGILQAPKLGTRQDWVEREKQGFEVLLSHALKGFKNMPAKGGNPAIKDEEIENAIIYMLVTAGFDQYAKPSVTGHAEKTATSKTVPDKQATTVKTTTSKTVPVKQAKAAKKINSNVNQFNRLMQPPAKWNLAPTSDGIHDPENAGTHLLQEPKQAFEALTRSKSGNRVDWVKALENNEIFPRYERLSDTAKPVVMDLNIVREVKGSMPDVVYPHKQHTEWLDCSNCHPAIFIPQKGANQISMAAILLGQKCGVCHGKVAFPISECRKCHSKQKATTAEVKN